MAGFRAASLETQAASVSEEADVGGLLTAIGAKRSEQAIELLFARYGEVIYKYCRRMLGNETDSDDVSQIVFLQAFQAIDAGVSVTNIRGWLIGIARHRCLDRIKARRHVPSPLETSQVHRLLDGEAVSQTPLQDPRAFALLDECLDALDDRSRVAIVLRFHDQLSYDEMSERMGDSAGALRVRVARALPALRTCLEKKGVAP